MPRVYIRTFGCQMNEQDSEIMRGLLRPQGYESVSTPAEADLILVNTCSVRERAYQKAMSEIGRLNHGEKKQLIGVTGCVASQEGENLLKRFHNIDFVLGTDHVGRLPGMVAQVQQSGKRVAVNDFVDLSDYEFPTPMEWGGRQKVKAYVTVMKGCDNTCSFCIVPFTRGKEVSRRPEEIIAEIRNLTQQGVREVTLLGQNVNSYGKRLEPRISFAKLLRRIEAETSLDRIRFTSPHPKDLSKELIEEYGRNSRLCPHVHLPVQSGSNRLLKRMRRSYTRESYLKKVESIRKVRPGIAMTTDLIVGFPGETEADFLETLELVQTVGYDQIYSFIYSPRPETEAATFEDDVPLPVKRERLVRLEWLQEQMNREKNQRRIALIEEVLVEGPSGEGGGQLTGRTPHGRIVNFDGGADLVGAIIKVMIKEATPYSLKGERWMEKPQPQRGVEGGTSPLVGEDVPKGQEGRMAHGGGEVSPNSNDD